MQSVRYKMRSLQATSDSVVAVETVLQLKIYDIFYYDVFKCDLIVVRRTSNAAILVKEKKKKKTLHYRAGSCDFTRTYTVVPEFTTTRRELKMDLGQTRRAAVAVAC